MNAQLVSILGRRWLMQRDVLISLLTVIHASASDATPQTIAASLPAEAVAAARSSQLASAGGVLVIPVCGVIMPRASWWGMSIAEFRRSFRQGLADDSVSAIVLDVDSPGGLVDGVPAIAREIFLGKGKKPIVASVNTLMASAAYWMGAQCTQILATAIDSETGSVGAYAEHDDVSEMLKQMGVKITLISAGEGKTDGNPYEPLSDPARVKVQDRINEIYGAFVAAVSRGRKAATRDQIRDVWHADVYSAEKALPLGLIDGIGSVEEAIALAAKLAIGAKSVSVGAALPVGATSAADNNDDVHCDCSPDCPCENDGQCDPDCATCNEDCPCLVPDEPEVKTAAVAPLAGQADRDALDLELNIRSRM